MPASNICTGHGYIKFNGRFPSTYTTIITIQSAGLVFQFALSLSLYLSRFPSGVRSFPLRAELII